MKMNILRFGVLLVVMLLLAPVVMVQAAHFDEGETIVIDEDVDDDLYLAGQTIIIEGDIDGDLVAAGQTMVINGDVTGDVIFAGAGLTVNGVIGDDLRAAGNITRINSGAEIGDDLIFAGAALEMRPETSVAGDAIFGAGQALLQDVAGNVYGGASAVRIDGEISGDAQLGVGGDAPPVEADQFMPNVELPQRSTIPAGLTFGDSGVVNGGLSVESEATLSIPDDAVLGSLTQTQIESEEAAAPPPSRRRPFTIFGRYVATFVLLLGLGLLINRLLPRHLDNLVTLVKTKPFASLGLGLLASVVLAAVIIALAITSFVLLIIGLGFGRPVVQLLTLLTTGSLSAFGFVARWVAPVLVALVVGGWLIKEDSEQRYSLKTLAVGLALVVLVLVIPIVGSLGTALVGLLGIGSVILTLRGSRERESKLPDVAVQPAK